MEYLEELNMASCWVVRIKNKLPQENYASFSFVAAMKF